MQPSASGKSHTHNDMQPNNSMAGGRKIFDSSEEDAEKHISYKYKFNNNIYNFDVIKVTSKSKITYSVTNKNNNASKVRRDCVTIFYNENDKFCYIETISIDEESKCYLGQQYNKKGTLLLTFVLNFIEQYIAKEYEVKYIQLKDNSQKWCKLVKNSIDLDSFYMFVNGKTWYGKYGFVPFDVDNIKTDKYTLKSYKKNQKKVNETLVKDTHIGKYIKDTIKKYDLDMDIDSIDEIIKIHKNYSIRKFLNALMNDYDTNCVIFYYIYKKLMEKMHMTNLHGKTYWKKL